MSEYEDIEFNEIDREKKVRKKKHYLARFLIFIGVICALVFVMSLSFFDVKNIKVDGNQYYSDNEVINIANAQTGVNIFWGTGDSDIKARLLDNPYFTEVKVKKKLPNTMIIKVKEEAQVAAVVYGDEYVIIAEDGTILRKSKVNPKVTLITGLTISKLKENSKIEAEESRTLKTSLRMLAAMKNGDIYFKKIDVSGVTIKAYIYDTLIVKGTPKQMLKAINDGDLQKVVSNLFKNKTTRGTINLGDHNYMSFSPDF